VIYFRVKAVHVNSKTQIEQQHLPIVQDATANRIARSHQVHPHRIGPTGFHDLVRLVGALLGCVRTLCATFVGPKI